MIPRRWVHPDGRVEYTLDSFCDWSLDLKADSKVYESGNGIAHSYCHEVDAKTLKPEMQALIQEIKQVEGWPKGVAP